MKIIVPKDCGNAPRKQIVLRFTEALLTGIPEVLTEHAHAEIKFHHLKDEKLFTGMKALDFIYTN